MGFRMGSYAELINIPEASLVEIPDTIDDQTAAATMMQGITASHFATQFYETKPGDIALVNAAAGGVGLLLTQITKIAAAKLSEECRAKVKCKRRGPLAQIMSSLRKRTSPRGYESNRRTRSRCRL